MNTLENSYRSNPQKRDGIPRYKHPLWSVYKTMKTRCYNTNSKKYPHYGGRGIQVCQRWLKDFWNFVDDMGDRPPGNHPGTKIPLYTLGRIDNDGDYTPENTRWETAQQQTRNRTSNKLIELDNETIHLSDLMKRNGIKSGTYYARIYKGWDTIEAATRPPRKGNYRGRPKQ